MLQKCIYNIFITSPCKVLEMYLTSKLVLHMLPSKCFLYSVSFESKNDFNIKQYYNCIVKEME